MNPWMALALFLSSLVADIFWARWTIATNERRGAEAAAWAFLICLPAVLWAPAYVQSRWYVLPYAAGAAIGTYVAIRWKDRKSVK